MLMQFNQFIGPIVAAVNKMYCFRIIIFSEMIKKNKWRVIEQFQLPIWHQLIKIDEGIDDTVKVV